MADKKTPKNNKDVTTNISDQAYRRALGGILGTSHNGDRDLWEVFGYPLELSPADYWGLYNRADIANRIIRAFPRATWRDKPVLTDEASTENDDEISPFAESWNNLEKDKKIYSFIERADRLSGLGQFAVLFMGFADGKDQTEPLTRGKAPLLYMSPYSEKNVTISKWNTDVTSPRFGLPETYTLQQGVISGKATPKQSFTVHHSRVLHIAEFLEDDEVYGTPRLMPVFNRLRDLSKVVGGSSEMFWLYARNILLGKADKDAQLTPEAATEIKAQMDELVHQLRSYIMAQGIEFSNFQGQAPDPKPNVEVLLDLIAGAVEIPKRILIGSERGELASTQDENNWSERIAERRTIFAAPMVLRPFIEKMIFTENVTEPKGEWNIEWTRQSNLTEAQRADVALKRAQTLTSYSNTPGVDDPTQTLTLRKGFEKALIKRFRTLKGLINNAIITRDGFGFRKNDREFAFSRDPDKVGAFLEWLTAQQNKEILTVVPGVPISRAAESAWTKVWIESAYKRGVQQAGQQLRKQGVTVEKSFVEDAFFRPLHADRAGLIYTRTFNDLKGITDQMDKVISRTLTQGIIDGKGPIEIARLINKNVDTIGIRRARAIARTEIIAAHAEASLNTFQEAGVEGVSAEVEFNTAGDDRVCPDCEALNAKIFTLAEARGIIPVHVSCRCAWLPVVENPKGTVLR